MTAEEAVYLAGDEGLVAFLAFQASAVPILAERRLPLS